MEVLDPGLVPDHSYPSGHVATSILVHGGIALWIGWVRPRWRRWTWPLFLVPLVVVTRVLLVAGSDGRAQEGPAKVEP